MLIPIEITTVFIIVVIVIIQKIATTTAMIFTITIWRPTIIIPVSVRS